MKNRKISNVKTTQESIEGIQPGATLSRRKFLLYGSGSFVMGSLMSSRVLASAVITAGNLVADEYGVFKFSAATKKLMAMFGLEYPIMQTPVSGVATPELVASVGEAGCLGSLPMTWSVPETARKTIAEVKLKTKAAFVAEYIPELEPDVLLSVLGEGVAAVQFSRGLPDPEQVKVIHSFNTLVGIQVSGKKSAQQALELGADYLLCRGTGAGGHVHASSGLDEVLEMVLSVAGNTPVIASGGIATGERIHELLSAGAAGVAMGTRFTATRESGAHQVYKEAYAGKSVAEIDAIPTVSELVERTWKDFDWCEFENS